MYYRWSLATAMRQHTARIKTPWPGRACWEYLREVLISIYWILCNADKPGVRPFAPRLSRAWESECVPPPRKAERMWLKLPASMVAKVLYSFISISITAQ